ncbi:MAG: DUF2161 family putative PD-(D/E)XK-type phosphodiesterase [Spirochaetales bacterium]|nr:DUF2161 family putative PD-(D/E)XK-type phosphodiesterase [Spirochaetales bacterium]
MPPFPKKETELYPPLRNHLMNHGYEVRGEVGKCDIGAVKGSELIVVEMKLRPSLGLLSQAVERQDYADAVYVALPGKPGRSATTKGFLRLIRRLGLGLLVVEFGPRTLRVEPIIHPCFATQFPQRREKRKEIMIREIHGRLLDLTPGGIPGGSLKVSAYRQRAMRLVVWLSLMGKATPAELKRLGAPEDAGTILSRNLYGWFERPQRGVYILHEAGEMALRDMGELSAIFQKEWETAQTK